MKQPKTIYDLLDNKQYEIPATVDALIILLKIITENHSIDNLDCANILNTTVSRYILFGEIMNIGFNEYDISNDADILFTSKDAYISPRRVSYYINNDNNVLVYENYYSDKKRIIAVFGNNVINEDLKSDSTSNQETSVEFYSKLSNIPEIICIMIFVLLQFIYAETKTPDQIIDFYNNLLARENIADLLGTFLLNVICGDYGYYALLACGYKFNKKKQKTIIKFIAQNTGVLPNFAITEKFI